MVRVQREKIRSGRKKNKRFEGEGEAQVLHSQKRARWARLSSGRIPARRVQGGSHNAGRCKISKKSGKVSSRSESCQEF